MSNKKILKDIYPGGQNGWNIYFEHSVFIGNDNTTYVNLEKKTGKINVFVEQQTERKVNYKLIILFILKCQQSLKRAIWDSNYHLEASLGNVNWKF